MLAAHLIKEATTPSQTAPDGSQLIMQSGDLWLWQVPNSTYQAVRNKFKTDKLVHTKPVPSGAGAIYYVSPVSYLTPTTYKRVMLTPDKAVKQGSDMDYRFITGVGDQLITLVGTLGITPGILKQLAKLTGAQHAPTLPASKVKNHVLHGGQVTPTKLKLQEYKVKPLSNGSEVYKTPKSLLWTINLHVGDRLPKIWDMIWIIHSPVVGIYHLASKDDHITGMYYPKNKTHAALKEIRELIAREALTSKVVLPDTQAAAQKGKSKKVKPGSIMHQMLAYVAEHPGANRSDWFVKHLGRDPQGMPGWTSDEAHDGVAAAMGWIKNEGTGNKYSLHITPVGKLVLARMNAGYSVPHTKQV